MISDQTTLVGLDTIIVADDRRPLNQTHVISLANSIAKDDLIHTPVVEGRTLMLCAGRHRLAAWYYNRKNGVPCPNDAYENWHKIPVRLAFNYCPADLARIELIENLRHRKLEWGEEVRGVKKIHELQRVPHPAWIAENTADLLGIDRSSVTRILAVEPHLDVPEVAACDSIYAAYNVVKRQANRSRAVAIENIVTGKIPGAISLSGLMGEPAEELQEEVPETPKLSSPIILQSFENFAEQYTGPRFNFLHCDFPYGINVSQHNGQGAITDINSYEDSPEVYWKLFNTLAKHQDNLVSHSCHIMFWFSQNFRRETEDFFYQNFPGCVVQPFLMVWHRSDSSGLCPDPQRYGRRNLETALLVTLGDRLIVKVKNLIFPFPGKDPNRLHKSEKPFEVVSYFMEMFVDEHSIMLDPTCGSGTALRAAHDLNAKTIVGVEKDPEMTARASLAYQTHIART